MRKRISCPRTAHAHLTNYFTGLLAEIEGRRHLIGVGIDIAARKRAEAALQESEARLKGIFEQAADGIFLITVDHRYLEANASGLELLGYTREELLQMTVRDVVSPAEQTRLAGEAQAMMAGASHLAEWEHRRKDGSTFVAEVSARRLDDATYIAIVRDLTERRRAEAALIYKRTKNLRSAAASRIGPTLQLPSSEINGTSRVAVYGCMLVAGYQKPVVSELVYHPASAR